MHVLLPGMKLELEYIDITHISILCHLVSDQVKIGGGAVIFLSVYTM